MRIVEMMRKIFEMIPSTLDVVFLSLTVIVAAYGAIKAYLEVPDFVRDLWDKLRDRDFRVKTTILKAIVAENQTQIIKLRNVRVHKKREKLELDRVPVYGPGPVVQDHTALVPNQYSVPGRSFVVPGQGGTTFKSISFLTSIYHRATIIQSF